jgi:23S rRNA (cytidine1920-2'-O)/16S rRNA (cytidine1409-2'-O)-methyltransferase
MPERLDNELVRRGLVRSRSEARTLISDGAVSVDGSVVTKPARRVTDEAEVSVAPDKTGRVSRGAFKLEAALEAFPVMVTGRRALDIGASTGGFTQTLLDRGAKHVTCLDVGRGQLAPELVSDVRVHSIEGRNVRSVTPGELGGCFELVTVDLSFISLRTVASEIAALLCEGGDLIGLVKPQFEVGREHLGRTGVVRSSAVRREAVASVIDTLGDCGLTAQGAIMSPVEGGEGNVEYLVWAVKGSAPTNVEVPE